MAASHSDSLVLLQEQSPKLYAFVEAVCADPEMNPERAAAAVGMPGKGGELMRDPRAHRILAAILGENREVAGDHRREAVRLLAMIVSYDPAAAFDQFGMAKNIHEIPPEVRLAITSYEATPDGGRKIKFVSRLEALKLLFAHFGDIENSTIAQSGTAQVIFRGRGA